MFPEKYFEKAVSPEGITENDVPGLLRALEEQPHAMMHLASELSRVRFGGFVDACAIINAKSGNCPEDCAFCAQSAHHDTDAETYPLVDAELILESAKAALDKGVKRFCIVTSGRGIDSDAELDKIAGSVTGLKDMGMLPCATLGALTKDQMMTLKDAGLNRLHHNVETARSFFPKICTSHDYDERVGTIAAAREVGLSVCSGGILGLGEEMSHRAEMALELREMGVDSVPVNILMPIPGTPFEAADFITPMEALLSIALFRFILPGAELRVCGGRVGGLGELHPMIFSAGANGLLTGDYLTTTGRDFDTDIRMLGNLGLKIAYDR